MNTSMRSGWTLLVCAGFTLVPLIGSANPTVPPELYNAIQNGEDVEIVLRQEEIFADDEWERSLTRESNETGVEVIFEKRVFSYEDGWECEDGYCNSPDEDSCDVDASTCYDCDGDDIPECPEPCEYWECYLSVTDECVPPGSVNYRIYKHQNEHECSEMDDLGTIVDDVGQDCPMGEDNDFVCLEEEDDDDSEADADSDPVYDDSDDEDDDNDDNDDNNDEGDYSIDGYPPESDSGCSATPCNRHQFLFRILAGILR